MNSRFPLEYTAEQAAARKSDYVCIPCGRQFLREDQLDRDGVVTMHGGECCLCGQRTGVTHVRAYNWLRVQHIEVQP